MKMGSGPDNELSTSPVAQLFHNEHVVAIASSDSIDAGKQMPMPTSTTASQTQNVNHLGVSLDSICSGIHHGPHCNKLHTIFIDLDDTMYPESTGVADQVRLNIETYLAKRFGLSMAEAEKMRYSLFVQYGTTLRGLQEKYDVDAYEYWKCIHGSLDYSKLIQPNRKLKQMIEEFPIQRKWILTNADRQHTVQVLSALQIPQTTFDGIVDVEIMQFHNKPDPESFAIALKTVTEHEIQNGSHDRIEFDSCLFLDDSYRNVTGARKLGIRSVLVNPQFCKCELDDKTKRLHQEMRSCWTEDGKILLGVDTIEDLFEIFQKHAKAQINN